MLILSLSLQDPRAVHRLPHEVRGEPLDLEADLRRREPDEDHAGPGDAPGDDGGAWPPRGRPGPALYSV